MRSGKATTGRGRFLELMNRGAGFRIVTAADRRSRRSVFLPQFANDCGTKQNIEEPDEENDCEA